MDKDIHPFICLSWLFFQFTSGPSRMALDWLTDTKPIVDEHALEMDKDIHKGACPVALFQFAHGPLCRTFGLTHMSVGFNYTCGLVDKGAAAGREAVAFIESLSAMQKGPFFISPITSMQEGIILAVSLNFLYGISCRFVSAPRDLLGAKCRQGRDGGASAHATAKDLALNNNGQLAGKGLTMNNGVKLAGKGLTPHNGMQGRRIMMDNRGEGPGNE
ncbi:hypothetical protein VC83_03167 [Pseudogymnoascus destructans]|uniref:Uncharacterized protein n=1 Tax=Pseudogymnoascus destructans TaxID=655981 RepID=A0A177ADZ3_9PEZI|nr:uncharacterized protein VC83_03167 [Pseudogymnoascus destructans]OAF60020.1 hypothetical protein VC83_03167 [Pseudogymnoascus destructans]